MSSALSGSLATYLSTCSLQICFRDAHREIACRPTSRHFLALIALRLSFRYCMWQSRWYEMQPRKKGQKSQQLDNKIFNGMANSQAARKGSVSPGLCNQCGNWPFQTCNLILILNPSIIHATKFIQKFCGG